MRIKLLLSCFTFLFGGYLVQGQDKENFSGSINLVEEVVVNVKDVKTVTEVNSLSVEDKSVKKNYLDGFGRPIQTLIQGGSPTLQDVVYPMEYDKVGRREKEFLPYTISGDGRYRPEAVGREENYLDGEQYKFYQNTAAVASDDYPYAKKVYEPSPLNRVVEQGAPGADWQPVTGHAIEVVYRSNGLNEVREWDYFPAQGFGSIKTSKFYGNGQLSVTETLDEHAKKIVEYKDKKGQVVQKRVQLNNTISSEVDWLITSYVYDDFGNLRLVIPPQGYATIGFPSSGTYTLTDNIRDQWCFYYHYDGRRRLIEKKVPGAAPVQMVYDQWDRLVLVQDGEQKLTSEWLYTKYDEMNRPILTGIYTDPEDRSGPTIQETLKSEPVRFETLMPQPGASSVYSNSSFPSEYIKPLSETYYDDYAFLGTTAWDADGHDYTYINEQLGNIKAFDRVNGLATGGKVNVLDTDIWLNQVNYYDDKYQLIQSINENLVEGTDRISMQYDFVGKVLKTIHNHTGYRDLVIIQDYEYDHAGRPLKTYHQVDNNDPVLLSSNEYNELGELVDKKLHVTNADGTEYHQSVDYRYNIRGWLTSINNAAINNDGIHNDDTGDYFGMELYYNKTVAGVTNAADLQYNGNISAVKWNNVGEKAHKYSYDNVNRIKGATYFEDNGTLVSTGKYNVSNIIYDRNGNIENLKRYGAEIASPIDNLIYEYGTGSNRSNRLLKVGDSGTEEGFKNGVNPDNDYDYYQNGNLKKDKNRGIASIAYNHLNLPSLITFTDGNTINYTYDAAGRKLKKAVNEGSESKVTDYSGPMIYEDEVLMFVQQAEGRIIMSDEDGLGIFPEYQYHIKDHLGNVRLTFTSEPKTDTDVATMETANQEDEYTEFQFYENATIINYELFDHTKSGDTHNAIRLNGTAKERTGLVKTLSVMPGDVIYTEVHAKYLDTDEQGDWTTVLRAFVASIINGTVPAGTILEGPPVEPGHEFPYPGRIDKSGDLSKVKAYLNYLVFDKDGNEIEVKCGYRPVTALAAEDGNGGGHQELNTTITITEPGLVYIYLSNDNPVPFDVFFDDFKVEHIQSPIVQADDYYPFGLSFNSYKRENSVANKYLFNGKEIQDALGLNVFDFEARMYDPAMGRTFQLDPHADSYHNLSAYSWVANNPLANTDPTGMDIDFGGGVGGGDVYRGEDMMNLYNQLRASEERASSENNNGNEGEDNKVYDGEPMGEATVTANNMSDLEKMRYDSGKDPLTRSFLNGTRSRGRRISYGEGLGYTTEFWNGMLTMGEGFTYAFGSSVAAPLVGAAMGEAALTVSLNAPIVGNAINTFYWDVAAANNGLNLIATKYAQQAAWQIARRSVPILFAPAAGKYGKEVFKGLVKFSYKGKVDVIKTVKSIKNTISAIDKLD